MSTLKRTCRLTTFHVISGLLLLGGTSAAHATQCTASPGSVLESSLLTQSFSDPQGGCEVDRSWKGDAGEGGDEYQVGPQESKPSIWQPPHIEWHRPHDGWHDTHDGRDCNPSVVPLPPSAPLLVSGALGLLILVRRRSSATA